MLRCAVSPEQREILQARTKIPNGNGGGGDRLAGKAMGLRRWHWAGDPGMEERGAGNPGRGGCGGCESRRLDGAWGAQMGSKGARTPRRGVRESGI